ncbi:hypothetical protein CR513_23102, partial [Mucuna pruriens]
MSSSIYKSLKFGDLEPTRAYRNDNSISQYKCCATLRCDGDPKCSSCARLRIVDTKRPVVAQVSIVTNTESDSRDKKRVESDSSNLEEVDTASNIQEEAETDSNIQEEAKTDSNTQEEVETNSNFNNQKEAETNFKSQPEAESDFGNLECKQTEAESDSRQPIPHSDRYAYLDDHQHFLVIIANNLHQAQEKLLNVLRKHKKAIRWTLSNLPGMNPSISMHKFLLEEDARSIRQQ